MAQAFTASEPFRARPDGLTPLPVPAPSMPALSAFGLRAAGRWTIPVEDLERAADLRREGKGHLANEALTALGWTTADAKEIWAALKSIRAQMPDREGMAPAVVRDSPFARLAELKAPAPAPLTRRRRPRPRRKKAVS
jgi:ATP-dependent RNA helicase SUPV3L1/SUV3